MKKRIVIMVIALLIVFGGIFSFDYIRSKMIREYMAHYKAPPAAISATKAKTVDWKDHITAVGSLASYQNVNITPQQEGQVKAIYYKSGQFVKKDQPLIKQNTDIDEQTLKNYQAQLLLDKVNLERRMKLATSSFVSQEDLDTARANYEETLADVNKTKVIIAQKTIKAPFAGKIGIREVNLGEYVSPSTQLTTLESLNPLRVLFYTPEQNLPKIQPGSNIELTVTAYPKKIFKGTITATSSSINDTSRNFQVQANVDNPKLELYPGMYAQVKVILPKTASASLRIIAAPFTPLMLLANFIASEISSLLFILLQVAVATASANIALAATITTASALPKLRECPTVPLEVQTPKGQSLGSICKPIFPESLESPAKIAILRLVFNFRKMSPPFSIIISLYPLLRRACPR